MESALQSCVCARVIVWDHTDEDAQVMSSVIILAIWGFEKHSLHSKVKKKNCLI